MNGELDAIKEGELPRASEFHVGYQPLYKYACVVKYNKKQKKDSDLSTVR